MDEQKSETDIEAAGDETVDARNPGRWQLIRDASVFQLKLLVDGLRDLVFAPISIALALIDLVTGGERYYRLLELGRRSEQWINLFGRYGETERSMDDAVRKVENMITEQYEKGGITATAKDSVDKALDRLTRDVRKDQS